MQIVFLLLYQSKPTVLKWIPLQMDLITPEIKLSQSHNAHWNIYPWNIYSLSCEWEMNSTFYIVQGTYVLIKEFGINLSLREAWRVTSDTRLNVV